MTLPLAPVGSGALPIDTSNVGGENLVSRSSGLQGGARAESGVPFADLLKEAVASANGASAISDQKVKDFASGAVDDIHGTMIAVKQADIELKLVANVRNKLVEAFNDLWRMNI
jgi:flagellar hook-basal body complex protein FliE